MMVSERLWVGTGPESDAGTNGVENCATARQAANAVKAGSIAVVPTTDVAYDAILAMGYPQAHAAHAVLNRNVGQDDLEDTLF
jgi:hypothetical protein